ncbi:MAG: hypothetical protein DWQ04_25445 [Chloroflexi bacterium]|nr:MAG: hypothetical protein DWQ04_25445 [Chloroflexota bacterium]
MAQLHICLLGDMQATWDDGCQLRLPPTAEALFSYLVLFQNRSHRREVLANLFWKERPYNKARRCLSTALWRLKRELADSDSCLDTSSYGGVKFENLQMHWVDAVAFEKKAVLALNQPVSTMDYNDILLLEEATQLYRGQLLEDYYDEWVLQERERLNLLYLRCLGRLMRYYRGQENWAKGILYGQKILLVDPLQEQVHRELMQFHLKNGQRSLAMQQYDFCRQVLHDDLGIEPMEETQVIYRHMMGQIHATANTVMLYNAERKLAEPLLQQIDAVMLGLIQAQEQLRSIREQVMLSQ